MRIIAQAVPVSLFQIFLLEPVQDCTEERIMQVPVLQIIEICRNHMPVLYVAFRLRRPKSPWRFPTCKLSLVRYPGTSVQPTGRPRRDTHTGHMLKVWCWPRSVRRRSWPWHKNPIYQALNSRHEPWSCRELGNHPTCCQVPAERDVCACGCICVAAVAAPRPLFMTSWCLRATCRRFSPRREECLSLSRSLVLPLSLLIACLRPFSPPCHRRGRRHRRSCASLTVTPWSISLTCPFHKNVLPCALSNK